jgi:SAM-dependent methyltransferase
VAAREEMALSFGALAAEYDRLRPSYPAAALDWAVAGADIATALDLGAGTGLLTRSLVDRGLRVVAVEPDGQMRAVLAGRLPEVTVRTGYADDIPLATGSMDAVFVGQAFHWFTRPAADHEIARVLRPGGILAVLTNVNPNGANYEDRLHRRVRGVPQPSLAHHAVTLAEDVFTDQTETRIGNPRPLSRADFLKLPSTWSWVATASEEERRQVAIEAVRLADQIQSADGVITMPYSTRIIRAVRRAHS